MYGHLAEGFSTVFDLDSPPVALAFVDEVPADLPTPSRAVPSACTFWRQAEAGTFFAPADLHFNCPVGARTMGFSFTEAAQQSLMGFVEKMTQSGYIALEEAERLPTVTKPKVGIVYGPLQDFPMALDLILMWLGPRDAMLYSEAVGQGRWTNDEPASVFGRPACTALPIALERDQLTLSLGCTGMRTFTDISENRLLAVVPGRQADRLVTALQSTHLANESMSAFYQEHKASFGL